VRDNTGKAGVLFIVATPIGNLDDISVRALGVLASVDCILAEDTRHSGRLLNHYDIPTPMLAYHDHNEDKRSDAIVEKLIGGEDMALISDAGTPLINDPGYVLVRAVQKAGIRVSPVPGSCSVIAALSASGLATDRFCYEGFLPSRKAARVARLQELLSETRTLVMLESSHRIIASIGDMAEVFGAQREAVIARELTKHFETIRRDGLQSLGEWLDEDANQRKGEFVVLVSGAAGSGADGAEVDRVLGLLLKKLPVRDAADLAASILSERKNKMYRRALELKAG
jgi:16S rRNA (cytidine1402-2'-O)-methyltransferase